MQKLLLVVDRRFATGLLAGTTLALAVAWISVTHVPSMLLVVGSPLVAALWARLLSRRPLVASLAVWLSFWFVAVAVHRIHAAWFRPWLSESPPWSPVVEIILPMALVGAALLWLLARVVVIDPRSRRREPDSRACTISASQ